MGLTGAPKATPPGNSLSASRILAGAAIATLTSQTLLAYLAPGAAAETASAGLQITALIARPELSLAAVAALAFAFMRIDHKDREAPAAGQSQRRATWANDGNRVTELTYSDPLTGMANRRRFKTKLDDLFARRQDSKKPFAVGLIDLDGFKQINGIYGHAAGDKVVRQVALRLEGFAGSHGFMARFSGGQFALLAPEVASEEQAAELAKLLSEVVNAPYDLDGRSVRISSSFGFALFPDFAETADRLMECADTALGRAGKDGHREICVYSAALDDALKQEARIEQALRKAIVELAIRPHFQPIVDLKTERVIGFESLARWHDDELGDVSPAVFIPIAEERGLIGEITELLLHEATLEAADWPSDIFLSFNLSTEQLADPLTSLKIMRVLAKTGFDPKRLEIEITETAVMSDPEMAAEIIDTLRQSGIRIALDDFGTGHSSLGYLRRLTLDKVKIDRCFVMDVDQEMESAHIVRAILEMCAGLKLKVVAEGIEEPAQLSSLKTFGCDAGQGYIFGKAMSASQTQSYLSEADGLAATA
ncbi:MAG TPA: EAL domain-containing protein [Afifellaceae bacterium]|nr:EAL domain-containing protein [Afifellaceae bacterium]